MVLSNTLKDSLLFEVEENKSLENASLAIRKGLVNFFSEMNEERNYTKEYEKILNLTEESIKKYADSQYKFNTALEPNEIEQIKKALINFTTDQAKISEFKNEIIEDLTAFQKQILINHKQKISLIENEKESYEKQLRILEFEKHKLIMDRLAKISWPYDSKTKEYDQKIAQLQAKITQSTNKLENIKSTRPAANERDLLLYKMQLREKFTARL